MERSLINRNSTDSAEKQETENTNMPESGWKDSPVKNTASTASSCTVGEGGRWPWSKKNRLQRNPSLDKVDETAVEDAGAKKEGEMGSDGGEATSGCPYMGVKSYLHLFYEAWPANVKDADLYEETDDQRRLLAEYDCRSAHKCTATWWKAFVMVGVLLLLAGVVSVLFGYLMPQKPTVVSVVGGVAGNREVIDREAIAYNHNLDACKLIGLILFCMGGLTLAVALMIPSFLYRYFDDDYRREPATFAISVETEEAPPLPVKEPLTIPSTHQLTEVQPARKSTEAVLVKDGMIAYDGQ